MPDDFRLMSLARSLVDDIAVEMNKARGLLHHDEQLRDSSRSIAANIREAYGRKEGGERNQFLRYARGSADETDEHLRAHFAAKRMESRKYWQLHNRLVVASRMISRLMQGC